MQRSYRTPLGLLPTTQRILGWPYGECVRAAYAAILGWPIRRVPRFDPAVLAPGEEQTDRERAWLATLRDPVAAPFGLDLHEIAVPEDQELPEEILEAAPPVEHFLSGISPRGHGHRVIGWGGRVIWDPHPSRAGLLTVFSIGFLVPR